MEQGLRGKRIYILEDNPDNVLVLVKLLEKHGAQVIVAWWFSGDSQRMLEHLPIDLILLDLMLPGQRTGIDVLAEIRKEEQLASIPALAVSAADPDVFIHRVREAGFEGFISKPIDIEQFPQQLASVLSGTPVWVS